MQASLPELPAAKRRRYLQAKLSPADVLTLTDDMATAGYFDAVLDSGAPLRPAANWIMGDLMAHCKVCMAPSKRLHLPPCFCMMRLPPLYPCPQHTTPFQSACSTAVCVTVHLHQSRVHFFAVSALPAYPFVCPLTLWQGHPTNPAAPD